MLFANKNTLLAFVQKKDNYTVRIMLADCTNN